VCARLCWTLLDHTQIFEPLGPFKWPESVKSEWTELSPPAWDAKRPLCQPEGLASAGQQQHLAHFFTSYLAHPRFRFSSAHLNQKWAPSEPLPLRGRWQASKAARFIAFACGPSWRHSLQVANCRVKLETSPPSHFPQARQPLESNSASSPFTFCGQILARSASLETHSNITPGPLAARTPLSLGLLVLDS